MEKTFRVHPYYAIGAIVLSILVLYVSLLPKQEFPETSIFQADKLVHITMYFVLSIMLAKGFFNIQRKEIAILLLPVCCAFGFSIIVEVLQHFATSTRFFDLFDIFANGIGSFFAFLVIKKYL